MKRAIVVGYRGQDGRLLMDRLLRDGNTSVGIGRGDCDLSDYAQVSDLVSRVQPEEVYYLPAYHHSAEEKLAEGDTELFRRSHEIHVTGLLNFLEAIKERSRRTRLFYAASSHVFGSPAVEVQDETTPFNPLNVYGITKVTGIHCCRFYREAHGLFAAVGILYNHESIYRRPGFVSQKIVNAARRIAAGAKEPLIIGDLSARIDWGYAPDYVDAMIRILGLPGAEDFVVATRETHSVQDFVETAFSRVGLNWHDHVREDASIITKRKTLLCGNYEKLKERTGWKPTVAFEEMIATLLAGGDAQIAATIP